MKTAILLLVCAIPCLAAEFHLAPSGNDANPGTQAKPFATLERARDAARLAKGSTVILGAGTYRLTKTLALDERDSETTYRAASGATVLITGGVDITASAVQPVKDNAILERIVTEEARPHIRQVDLKQFGMTDFGELGPRGYARGYIPAPTELFINGEPCQIARWPNVGEKHLKMGKVVEAGSNPRARDYRMKPGVFKYDHARVARWTQAEDLFISGLFSVSWADDTLPVAKIDTEAGTLTTKVPHLYTFRNGTFTSFYGLNLIEELDVPGEYFVDRKSGILYFYPPQGVDLAHAHIQVSQLPEVLVALEGASRVRFENLIFENSRSSGIYIERGSENLISGCTFRNLGELAVQMGKGTLPYPEGRNDGAGHIEGGKDGIPVARQMGNWYAYIYQHTAWNREAGTGHGLLGCTIYNMGAGGVSLGGGDRKTLIPAGNFVRNCDIHHVNRLDRTYKACVNVDGVGNIIEHNQLHDTEAQAVYLHGNDHRIEFNEIAEVCRDISDMGAIYMGRDTTECGTMIRHNFFHDIRSHHSGGFGVQAIFFDDHSGFGATIEGNVFYKAGSSAVIKFFDGGGVPITNNIFVDCPAPVIGLGDGGQVVCAMKYGSLGQQRSLKEVNVTQPPYTTRYPEMTGLYANTRKMTTPIERNYVVRNNYANFVDVAGLNFSLKPGADVGVPGFQLIPFDKIGPGKKP